MKRMTFFILLTVWLVQVVSACPLCEKQQPKITQGLIHGAGPQSNWDWLIVGIVTAIASVTFFLSLKYLIYPKEKNIGHIKQSILNNQVR